MSCNSCSNITLPGVAGPAGAPGAAGADGNDGTNGTDGIDGVDGTNGTDGITLLHTLTSASSDITSASYTSALPGVWGISSNTLNTNGDTLRLQAQTMITPGDLDGREHGLQVLVGNSNPPTQSIVTAIPGITDYPLGFYYGGSMSYFLEVDMIRVSSTTIRMESNLRFMNVNPLYSNYANEIVVKYDYSSTITNSAQVITVNDLSSNSLYMDIKLRTYNSIPVKLLKGKLYLLDKLVNT